MGDGPTEISLAIASFVEWGLFYFCVCISQEAAAGRLSSARAKKKGEMLQLFLDDKCSEKADLGTSDPVYNMTANETYFNKGEEGSCMPIEKKSYWHSPVTGIHDLKMEQTDKEFTFANVRNSGQLFGCSMMNAGRAKTESKVNCHAEGEGMLGCTQQ